MLVHVMQFPASLLCWRLLKLIVLCYVDTRTRRSVSS